MEKRTPHHDLPEIQELVSLKGADVFTRTAVLGATAMGLSKTEAVEVVLGLTRSMFYKSMTTLADRRVWQDVYNSPTPVGRTAYVKLTRREHGAVVIQFKEK